MPVESDEALRSVLEHERVAVVGCSSTPGKDAHEIPGYLLGHGYDVVPVNPYAEEIFGREAYDDLSEVPGAVPLVDVFRPSDEVGGVVEAAIERGDVEVMWTQLGIRDPAATERAEAAGLQVVEDRCIKVEHARLTA
jgi:predicted CoA-binding protein